MTTQATRSSIMRRAWTIRRAAAARYACRSSEILFSPCLRLAWREKNMKNMDWTAAEEQGIAATVTKLKAANAETRAKMMRLAEETVRSALQEALTKRDKLEHTMQEYERRNVGATRDTHPLYKDYQKAQTRHDSARRDFQKLQEIARRVTVTSWA